jgi:hypothetical protein
MLGGEILSLQLSCLPTAPPVMHPIGDTTWIALNCAQSTFLLQHSLGLGALFWFLTLICLMSMAAPLVLRLCPSEARSEEEPAMPAAFETLPRMRRQAKSGAAKAAGRPGRTR